MKRLTAHHEAAHIVLAYLSTYHFLAPINTVMLTDDSADTFITLSKKKLISAGKPLDRTKSLKDKEIIEDFALATIAGFPAEQKYYEINKEDNTLPKPDKNYSENDYSVIKMKMSNAEIPVEIIENYETIAINLVNTNWESISHVAEMFLESTNNSLDTIDVIDYLDSFYGRNSF